MFQMRSQIKTNLKWAEQIVLITKFQKSNKNNVSAVIDTAVSEQMKQRSQNVTSL